MTIYVSTLPDPESKYSGGTTVAVYHDDADINGSEPAARRAVERAVRNGAIVRPGTYVTAAPEDGYAFVYTFVVEAPVQPKLVVR
jgi:hypothetical protein